MNREQMIAWLTLEGWEPIEGGRNTPARWIENPEWGAVYSYYTADTGGWDTGANRGWVHDADGRDPDVKYKRITWQGFQTATLALLFEEVNIACK